VGWAVPREAWPGSDAPVAADQRNLSGGSVLEDVAPGPGINTSLAHQLGRTGDWVVIYHHSDTVPEVECPH
jgi:hypothetical protein